MKIVRTIVHLMYNFELKDIRRFIDSIIKDNSNINSIQYKYLTVLDDMPYISICNIFIGHE